MMKWILSTFFQALVIAFFCFLIWITGSRIQIDHWMPLKSVEARLLVILSVILLWVLITVLKQRSTKISEKKLTTSIFKIKSNPNLEKDTKKIQEFNQDVQALIVDLRKSQIMNGKKVVSIDNLPWYLVVGSRHSGKTALIENSGLHFPQFDHQDERFQKEQVPGLMTYVSEEAVFIEYSRFKAEPNSEINMQSDTWKGILTTLKKYKKGKALNGLIITVDMSEVIHEDATRETRIKALRRYIVDLYHLLGIQLPVYVVLTKCDALSGFLDFFGRCDIDNQNQVLGFTFPIKAFKEGSIAENFGTEYDKFVDKLNDQLLWLMEAEQSLNRRESINLFPQQFALLKNVFIERFLEIFQANKLYELVHFRGVYFTSALPQDGVLSNPLNLLIGKQFDVKLPARSQKITQSQTLFIKDVFQKIIFPEHNLVNYSDRVYRSKYLLQSLSYCFAVIMLSLGSFLFIKGYVYNKHYLLMVERILKETKLSQADCSLHADSNLIDVIKILNSLKFCLDAYNSDAKRWLLSYEIYKTVEVKNNIELIFNSILMNDFLPKVAYGVERQLIAKQGDFESLYNVLKAYLALGDPARYPKEWIENVAQFLWQQDYNLNEEEKKHLSQYLHLAVEKNVQSLNINQDLVQRTIVLLTEKPLASRIYAKVKEQSNQKSNQTLDLMKLANQSNAIFNESEHRYIDPLFTNNGFIELYSPALFAMINSYHKDGILVKSKVLQNEYAVTPEMLTNTAVQFYTEDYVNQWQQALESLKIEPFANYEDAILKINQLRSENSPLKKVLNIFSHNVNVLFKDKELKVADSFSNLCRLGNNETINKTINVDNILKNLDDLYNVLIKMKQEPDINKASFLITNSFMTNDNNPFEQILIYANQLPKPLNEWYKTVAIATWEILMHQSHQYINTLWKKEIISKFDKFKHAYPFNEKTKQWINMEDFDEFFSGGGLVENFYNEYLKSYLDVSETPWRWAKKYDSSMSDFVEAAADLEAMLKIKQAYFPNNNKKMDFDFVISPLDLSPNVASVLFKVGEQQLVYRHGPIQEYRFKWPSPKQSDEITIVFKDFNNHTVTHTFDGPWSFFKLMSEAKLEKTSHPDHFKVMIAMNDFHAHFIIKKLNSRFMLHFNQIKKLRLPEDL